MAEADPAIIDAADQITPGWLDAVLGTAGTRSAVRRVTTEPVGTGQMATTVRAHLELGDGTDRTVVVKFARADVAAGPLAQMAYGKEVAFYDGLAERLAVRTPECLHAAIAPDGARFALVLEDMLDARPGDQIAGCPVDHAEAALVNLAGLHGPTWCDGELSGLGWLAGEGPPPEDLLIPVLAAAADGFAERFGAELAAGEAAVLAASRELLVPWLVAPAERFAVVHGDYRLDNLLFPPGDPARVAAVDWQTVGLGPPGRDVAFFLGTCLAVDDRRRHERDLVAAYHAALADYDVAGYRLEDCWEDYRLGMLHGPFITLLGRLTATVTARGDEMFRVMWRRSSAAIEDLGTVAAVRARVAAS
jgi:Phosphotransferase enzyme family